MDTKWTQRFGILSHVVKNKPNEEEKTMKKKWLVLCCVGMLSAFAMTGCGSSADTTAPAEETQEVEDTTEAEEAAEDADAADAEAEDATEENAAADDAQEEVPAEDAEAAQE